MATFKGSTSGRRVFDVNQTDESEPEEQLDVSPDIIKEQPYRINNSMADEEDVFSNGSNS